MGFLGWDFYCDFPDKYSIHYTLQNCKTFFKISFLLQYLPHGPRKRLIIDTDTGVDDAMALLMALEAHKRGEVEVVAITAVAGNTQERHALRNILRTLGRWNTSTRHGQREVNIAFYWDDPIH